MELNVVFEIFKKFLWIPELGRKVIRLLLKGEINRLVQSKPEERRVIIEEVAGITKFKLRKKESLKKWKPRSKTLRD